MAVVACAVNFGNFGTRVGRFWCENTVRTGLAHFSAREVATEYESLPPRYLPESFNNWRSPTLR